MQAAVTRCLPNTWLVHLCRPEAEPIHVGGWDEDRHKWGEMVRRDVTSTSAGI